MGLWVCGWLFCEHELFETRDKNVPRAQPVVLPDHQIAGDVGQHLIAGVFGEPKLPPRVQIVGDRPADARIEA